MRRQRSNPCLPTSAHTPHGGVTTGGVSTKPAQSCSDRSPNYTTIVHRPACPPQSGSMGCGPCLCLQGAAKTHSSHTRPGHSKCMQCIFGMDASGSRAAGGADQHRRKRPREDARKPAVAHDSTVKKRRDKYSSASDGSSHGHDDSVGHFQGREGTSITDRCAYRRTAVARNLRIFCWLCRQNHPGKWRWDFRQSSPVPRQKA